MALARTITTHLVDGNPNGIKIVDLSNRTIRAYLIPRAKLKEYKSNTELDRPAIYFLCERSGEQVYIGECESFSGRVRDHDQNKDFWEIAVIFITKDNGLEKGDIKYLESIAIQEAKDASRFKVVNGATPKKNRIHQFKQDTIEEFYQDLKLLISALGYPIFDKVLEESATEDQIWYCKGRATEAKAIYNEQGFTVVEGSIIDGTERPSFVKRFPASAARRKVLLKEKATVIGGKMSLYKLKENITFSSANQAGEFCMGGYLNAWTTWKNKEGKTMDEVLRK